MLFLRLLVYIKLRRVVMSLKMLAFRVSAPQKKMDVLGYSGFHLK